jgi:hypothetical protein
VDNYILFPFGWGLKLYFDGKQVAIIILRIELDLNDCGGIV